MANNTFTARQLTGFNVYHLHDKNQTIYYDMYTKTGYIITNQHVNSFSSWQNRLPLCIIASAVMILFNANPFVSIGLGLAIYGVSTILFHTTFLKKLPINKNFVKPKSRGFFKETAARYPFQILVIITIMFFGLGVLMLVNKFVNQVEGGALTITYIFTVISFVAAIIMGYTAYIKKKENL